MNAWLVNEKKMYIKAKEELEVHNKRKQLYYEKWLDFYYLLDSAMRELSYFSCRQYGMHYFDRSENSETGVFRYVAQKDTDIMSNIANTATGHTFLTYDNASERFVEITPKEALEELKLLAEKHTDMLDVAVRIERMERHELLTMEKVV